MKPSALLSRINRHHATMQQSSSPIACTTTLQPCCACMIDILTIVSSLFLASSCFVIQMYKMRGKRKSGGVLLFNPYNTLTFSVTRRILWCRGDALASRGGRIGH